MAAFLGFEGVILGYALSAAVGGGAAFLSGKILRRDSCQTLHDAVDSSAHGLLFFDKDEKFSNANRQAFRFIPEISGTRARPQTLNALLNYLYDHAIDCDDSLVSAVDRSTGTAVLTQGFREVLPWGKDQFCLVQAQRTRDGGTVVIISDITRQKEREEDVQRLLRLNRELVAAVEESTSGIIISDPKRPEHPIIFINRAFGEIIGLPRDEIVGNDWRFVFDALECFGMYEKLVETIGENRVLDIELYTDGARDKWYNLRVSPVLDKKGNLDLLIGIQTDITQLKVREAEFFQAQKLEALGQLAGGVAHDFNNVLSIIDGYSRMVQKDTEKGSKAADYLARIRTAAQRGAGLTRQLLTFGRHKIVSESAVDLGQFIEDMKPMLMPLMDTAVDIRIETAPEKVYIDCSPDELAQVVMNLVINARDAMPEGGSVSVGIGLPERWELPDIIPAAAKEKMFACLYVRDTGTGMDHKTIEKIFDPFFTTKEQGKGTGLGLSVVYGLVRQMEGYIDVRSALGEGTSMMIYFPVTDKRPLSRKSVEAGDDGDIRFEGYTALVAEDEPDILEIVSIMLERMGMKVLRASNGNEALLRQDEFDGNIDFLITDVVMPELNGVRLAELFSSLRPETFIVFMSGYPAGGALARVELPEGAYFMAKPINYESLAALLHECVKAGGKIGFENSSAAVSAYHWRADGAE